MDGRSQVRDAKDCAAIVPPRWTPCVMALTGVALAIGPTLGMLWPR